jgi:hypothetical protein
MSERPTDPRRRNLLLAGLATVAGVGGAAGVTAYLDGQTPLATNEPSNGVRSQGGPMPRRRLGRTNLEVGVVGVGAGGVSDGEIFARAVELGMNYVDTAICYGDSELVLGRAFATRPGLREKVVLATKWDPAGDSPKSRILASLDQSLKRLQTDRTRGSPAMVVARDSTTRLCTKPWMKRRGPGRSASSARLPTTRRGASCSAMRSRRRSSTCCS